MGEVYRALDTKLGREVALKVLPPEIARDPEHLSEASSIADTVSARPPLPWLDVPNPSLVAFTLATAAETAIVPKDTMDLPTVLDIHASLGYAIHSSRAPKMAGGGSMISKPPISRTLAVALVSLSTATATAQVDSILNQAVELFEDEKFEQARGHFGTVFEQDPENARAAYYLGRLAYIDSDFETAIDLLEKAVEIDRHVSDFYLWLARAYVEKVQRASTFTQLRLSGRVKENLVKAVELDPKSVDARWDLANYYMVVPGVAGGDKEKGQEQISKLTELDPKRVTS